jgi:hypothetical protein
MAQGAWDTGTWDEALWDSLPVTGNTATGSPGNVGISATVPITGNTATGSPGTIAPNVTIGLSGVQATGQVGTEGDSATVPITGALATGSPGTVGMSITIALSGNGATGSAGNVIFVQPIIVIDDTHDGKRFKEILEKERKLRDAKKQAILDAFERIVEGRPDIAEEIAAPFVIAEPKTVATTKPTINFDALFADLDRVQRIWDTHLEMDDEDILKLL